MGLAEEEVNQAIGDLMGDQRDYKLHPLTQEELICVIETFTHESKKPHLRKEVVNYYHKCLEVLKSQVLYN